MDIKHAIPHYVDFVLQEIQSHGQQASIVGGAVRDLVMGRTPTDFDLVSSAEVQDIMGYFARVLPLGEKHGTVVVFLDEEKVEVSRCKDGCISDEDWLSSLRGDLLQRDFTINAMAIDADGQVFDPFGGKQDIKRKVIRSPQDQAVARFQEDPLRMLRAVRLSTVLDFTLGENLPRAITDCRPLLEGVAVERIREELAGILLSDRPGQGIKMLVDMGLMEYIIPEILATVGFDQQNPAHTCDVFSHTLAVLDQVPAHLEIRLAALLHDIGKPATFTCSEEGIGHFYQHQLESTHISEQVLSRLKFSRSTVSKVTRLVSEHMSRLEQPTPGAVRRLIARVGEEVLDQLFTLQRADILAGAAPYSTTAIVRTQQLAEKILASENALSIKDLAVNGNDLIAIGYQPGKEIGTVLNRLLDIVLGKPEANQKASLLEAAARWLENAAEREDD